MRPIAGIDADALAKLKEARQARDAIVGRRDFDDAAPRSRDRECRNPHATICSRRSSGRTSEQASVMRATPEP